MMARLCPSYYFICYLLCFLFFILWIIERRRDWMMKACYADYDEQGICWLIPLLPRLLSIRLDINFHYRKKRERKREEVREEGNREMEMEMDVSSTPLLICYYYLIFALDCLKPLSTSIFPNGKRSQHASSHPSRSMQYKNLLFMPWSCTLTTTILSMKWSTMFSP